MERGNDDGGDDDDDDDIYNSGAFVCLYVTFLLIFPSSCQAALSSPVKLCSAP